MKTRNDSLRRANGRKTLLGALGLAAVMTLLAGAPALADNDRGRGDRGPRGERHGRQYDNDDRGRDRHDRRRQVRRDHRDHRKERKADRRHDRRYDRRRDHRHLRYGHDYDLRHDRRHHHRRFVVPGRIHLHGHRDYRPYFHTRVYFPAHRHHHVVYRFPVYTARGVFYRDYPYCDGVLLQDGISGYLTFNGRHVSIGIGF